MSGIAVAKKLDPEVVAKQVVKLEIEEWKECRTTIGRFDSLLVDLRKYGFTLITGLLTASSFWFATQGQGVTPTVSEVGVALVLTVLVIALFVIDRSYEVLLHAAVNRGKSLEAELPLKLTTDLSVVAAKARTDTWATATYTLFLVAAQIPWLLSWLELPAETLRVLLMLGVLGLVIFALWYHGHTEQKEEADKENENGASEAAPLEKQQRS